MAPNTQIGKFEIPVPVSYAEHPDMYTSDEEEAKYSRSGEMLENLMSGNHIEFCKRWLHLADFTELISDMYEYFGIKGNKPMVPIDLKPTDGIYETGYDVMRGINEVTYRSGIVPAIFIYDDMPNNPETIISNIAKGAFV